MQMCDEEFHIEMSDEMKQQTADNPAMAQAWQDLCAKIRQAHHGVKTGQYQSMDDAMEILTGFRPEKFDMDGNRLEEGAYPDDVDSIEFISIGIERDEEG